MILILVKHFSCVSIWPMEKRLCVPRSLIRDLLVKKAHEGGLMGHFGELKTYEILFENFFWPRMKKDIHHIF
ncbi:hypothetical protein CR513_48113, partial [Mucuna pruriens]